VCLSISLPLFQILIMTFFVVVFLCPCFFSFSCSFYKLTLSACCLCLFYCFLLKHLCLSSCSFVTLPFANCCSDVQSIKMLSLFHNLLFPYLYLFFFFYFFLLVSVSFCSFSFHLLLLLFTSFALSMLSLSLFISLPIQMFVVLLCLFHLLFIYEFPSLRVNFCILFCLFFSFFSVSFSFSFLFSLSLSLSFFFLKIVREIDRELMCVFI